MKLVALGAAILGAAILSCPASAQIPPELLGGGGSKGEAYSEAFYKGPEGTWVLRRNKQNDGYGCSVTFITKDSTFAFHGPLDSKRREPDGMVTFQSPKIPRPKRPDNTYVLLKSTEPDANYPMTNIDLNDGQGTFIMAMPVEEMYMQKNEIDPIALVYQNKEVFQSTIIRMPAALKQLKRCIEAKPQSPKGK